MPYGPRANRTFPVTRQVLPGKQLKLLALLSQSGSLHTSKHQAGSYCLGHAGQDGRVAVSGRFWPGRAKIDAAAVSIRSNHCSRANLTNSSPVEFYVVDGK